MEHRIAQLEEEIQALKERNERVEREKAWETSLTRITTIALITYVFAAFALHLIGAENALLGALIPVLGFVLSTRSLPLVKRWWGRGR